jgi:PAS domain S-box-containing protein
MSLRTKVFLIIGGVLVTFFFIVFQLVSTIIAKDFYDLERRETTENALRVTDALASKLDELALKLGDWAQWDDTYQFIQESNEDYIQSNLQNESFEILKINMMVILDREGKILFQKQVENKMEEPMTPGFIEHLVGDVARGDISPNGMHKEIKKLSGGVVVYAARPVTSSDGSAPINGYIVFGYFLGQDAIDHLSQVTHLKVDMLTYDAETTDTGFVEARSQVSSENPLFIRDPGKGAVIESYTFIGDEDQDGTLILRVTTNRDTYEKGREGIILFTRAFALAMMLFSTILFFLLNRLVLRRLSGLSDQVEEIRESGDITKGVMLSGKDEFSSLAERINQMLLSLQEAEEKRKESEKRFRTVADSAPVMIWMSDINRKCTYVNKVWLDYTGRSLEEELGQGWKSDVHPDDVKRSDDAYEQAFARQQVFSVEYRLKGSDGTYKWFFARAVPHFTTDQLFLGYIGSCVDITERKEAEERRVGYIEEIEKMNRIMVERELKMIELKEKIKKLERHV